MMRESPIIFDAESVRGIISGRKGSTLRAMSSPTLTDIAVADRFRLSFTDPRHGRAGFLRVRGPDGEQTEETIVASSHYGGEGDHLWVKESFLVTRSPDPKDRAYVEGPLSAVDAVNGRPDGLWPYYRADKARLDGVWRTPLYMPRWASRLTLAITSVTAMRLQDITTDQIRAEGVDDGRTNPAMGERHDNAMRMAFAERWDAINGRRKEGVLAWARNPWVWRVEFGVEILLVNDVAPDKASRARPNITLVPAEPAEVIQLHKAGCCARCGLPIRRGEFFHQVPTPDRAEVHVHRRCMDGSAPTEGGAA